MADPCRSKSREAERELNGGVRSPRKFQAASYFKNQPRFQRVKKSWGWLELANAFIDTAKRPPVYFYHIPKTGGMSLRSFLADQYSLDERCPARNWSELARTPRDLLSGYSLVYGHFSANLRELLPFGVKTFTFLRDPIERTISAIRHMLRDPLFHPMHEIVRGATLRQLIYNDAFMETLRNAQTTLLSFDIPMDEVFALVRRKEAQGLPFELGDMEWTSSLAKAQATLDTYAYVGLMERFDESLRGICQAFNFMPPEAMPELNRAVDSGDPGYNLDAKDIDHVESFLADDIAIYAAAKAKFEAAPARQEIIGQIMSRGVMTAIAAPCEINLGFPFAGSGWYEPERQSSGLTRWSGPNNLAQLYLPLDRGETRRLLLRLWRKEKLDEVSVSIDGEDVAVRKVEDDGLLYVEVELPALPAGGVEIVTVVVDARFVTKPSERGDGDLRHLGVMLLSVAIN
jgi:hypothetical protein